MSVNPKAKKFVKKVPGIDPKSRADHGKSHVIISEKKDKKAAKYLVKDLPYPYTSKAQFEKVMSTPVGTEWNSRETFQKQTLPRVLKKVSTVESLFWVYLTFCLRWEQSSILWKNYFEYQPMFLYIECYTHFNRI